jgi:Putative peptidoglycan binding domain
MKAWTVLCAALMLVTSGCAAGSERAEVDLSGVPECADIWVDGKTLPADYEGCVGASGNLVLSAMLACVDGSQFTTHEDLFFARVGGTITAGPGRSPETAAAYSKALSDCHEAPRPASADEAAPGSEQRSTRRATVKDFETFAGDIFTVTLLDTRAHAAHVRFCATAPYEGGPIPITRSPWGIQDQQGTVWPADDGDVDLHGNAYPVEASVSVGDCLQGWVPLTLPSSTTAVRVVYDSDIGGPFTWDVTSAGATTLPDPPAPETLAVPIEPPAYPEPQRDCYTLESAASPFSGNWLTLETRGQFTDETLQLQDRLNWMGFGCIPEDGDYGPVTREAVIRFQRALGLVVDGKVGPQTWEAVFSY